MSNEYTREECEALANMVKAQPQPSQAGFWTKEHHDEQAETMEALRKLSDERDQARESRAKLLELREQDALAYAELDAKCQDLAHEIAQLRAQVAHLLALCKTADTTIGAGVRTLAVNADAWQAIRAAIARAEITNQ